MCSILASALFNYWLVDFQTKYSPGNVFLNKGLLGFFDILAIFFIQFLQIKLERVKPMLWAICSCMVVLSGTNLLLQ